LGFAAHDPVMRLGASAREAAEFCSQIGPTARAIADAPEDLKPGLRDAARQGMEREFSRGHGAAGVALKGAIWIVSAQAGDAAGVSPHR
jgi:hypothetical protein